MEVGPLDGEMLRSWYQQGLITREAKIRAKGSKQWVRLVDTFDISDWGAAGGSARGSARGKPGPEDLAGIEEDDEGFEDVGPQTWRTYLACALFFLLAAAAGYFTLFPSVWRTPPDTPWREIALGFVVLGLLLVRGWEPMRKLVRVLVLILTLGLFPLAEVLIFRGVPWRSLVVLFPPVVWASASSSSCPALQAMDARGPQPVLDRGGRGRRGAPRRFPAAGGGGLDGGAVTVARRARAGNAAGFAPRRRPSADGAGRPAATCRWRRRRPLPPPLPPRPRSAPRSAAAVMQEVPLLSPRAAEAVRARAVFAVEDAFRRSYELAGNGVGALTAPERRELGELMAAAYANIFSHDRRRLEIYTAGIRGGQTSTPEQNREMSAIMRTAVLKLPEPQRARLQALYEKAILAAR